VVQWRRRGNSPLLLYGGGLKTGQVVGRSSRDAGEPATEPYGIKHLIATIMHMLFDPGVIRLRRDVPGDVARRCAL